MKLSEAIRLRGIKKPQGRGSASIVSRHAPCALGGALQAIGQQPEHEREAIAAITRNWEFTLEPAMCPCCSKHGCQLMFATIVFLNDVHMWTRKQIADWVATVEPPSPRPDEKAMPVEWKRAA